MKCFKCDLEATSCIVNGSGVHSFAFGFRFCCNEHYTKAYEKELSDSGESDKQ